jgi:hypothetical protein
VRTQQDDRAIGTLAKNTIPPEENELIGKMITDIADGYALLNKIIKGVQPTSTELNLLSSIHGLDAFGIPNRERLRKYRESLENCADKIHKCDLVDLTEHDRLLLLETLQNVERHAPEIQHFVTSSVSGFTAADFFSHATASRQRYGAFVPDCDSNQAISVPLQSQEP